MTKSIKQNTSLKKSPIKIVRFQGGHTFASFIAYCKLEFPKIKTSLNHFALGYRIILKAKQMACQELQTLQRNSMSA
ncbi:hypothetical protein NEOC84_001781|nr:hypothetical protein [Neochlamydia sp. AcF84]